MQGGLGHGGFPALVPVGARLEFADDSIRAIFLPFNAVLLKTGLYRHVAVERDFIAGFLMGKNVFGGVFFP